MSMLVSDCCLDCKDYLVDLRAFLPSCNKFDKCKRYRRFAQDRSYLPSVLLQTLDTSKNEHLRHMQACSTQSSIPRRSQHLYMRPIYRL